MSRRRDRSATPRPTLPTPHTVHAARRLHHTPHTVHAARRLHHTPHAVHAARLPFPPRAPSPPSRRARGPSPVSRGEKPTRSEVGSPSRGPAAAQRRGHGADSGGVSPWPGSKPQMRTGESGVRGARALAGAEDFHAGPRLSLSAGRARRHVPASPAPSVEEIHVRVRRDQTSVGRGPGRPARACGEVAGRLVSGEEATPAGPGDSRRGPGRPVPRRAHTGGVRRVCALTPPGKLPESREAAHPRRPAPPFLEVSPHTRADPSASAPGSQALSVPARFPRPRRSAGRVESPRTVFVLSAGFPSEASEHPAGSPEAREGWYNAH